MDFVGPMYALLKRYILRPPYQVMHCTPSPIRVMVIQIITSDMLVENYRFNSDDIQQFISTYKSEKRVHSSPLENVIHSLILNR